MKPINEKERTVAFVQFLVLFILTVILTIFFVFSDYKVRGKDYELLKSRANEHSTEEEYFNNLRSVLDTLQISIKNLDNVEPDEIEDSKYVIRTTLLKKLDSDNDEVAYQSSLKQTMKTMCDYWMIDKGKLKEIDNLKAKIISKDKTIGNYKDLLIQKGVQPDVLDAVGKED